MNSIATAVLICLLSQSIARADELVTGVNPRQGEATTLSRAITVEAARLAKSGTRTQSSQLSNKTDTRPWCVRHGAGCFALIGFAAGFIGGLAHPAEDFVPEVPGAGVQRAYWCRHRRGGRVGHRGRNQTAAETTAAAVTGRPPCLGWLRRLAAVLDNTRPNRLATHPARSSDVQTPSQRGQRRGGRVRFRDADALRQTLYRQDRSSTACVELKTKTREK